VTRILSEQIMEKVVPALETQGFRGVGICLGDPDQPVSGGDLRFERRVADKIDSVTFNFEKYRTPSVQVHLARRGAAPPHEFILSGNLVSRPWQYYHFWGKPWWYPTRFWPHRSVVRTVELILGRLQQAVDFLEQGKRGSGISKEVRSAGVHKLPRNDV
jgi:hypothetical protein